MFNDLIDERKAMSVSCSHEFKNVVLIQREKLVNNIIISFWNYKRVPISMATLSNTG